MNSIASGSSRRLAVMSPHVYRRAPAEGTEQGGDFRFGAAIIFFLWCSCASPFDQVNMEALWAKRLMTISL
jgi:hypothetical protein